MAHTEKPEPWLRGTWREIPPVHRAVLHALELAREHMARWCGKLSAEQLQARPGGIAPVAFHLRHMARSLDRLLSYTEGQQLGGEQLAALQSELAPGGTPPELFAEFSEALDQASQRIRALASAPLDQPRTVGRNGLPTSVGGLLVHIAEHTQRHAGQAITTAKLVASPEP